MRSLVGREDQLFQIYISDYLSSEIASGHGQVVLLRKYMKKRYSWFLNVWKLVC